MSTLTPDPLEATRTPPPTGPNLLTLEEFLRDYGDRYAELVAGVPVLNEPSNPEYVMPGSDHGQVCIRISHYLIQHVLQHDLGRAVSHDSFVIVSTNPHTVRGPDVYFAPYTRAPRGQRLPEAVPADWLDLVVEVRSPSNTWTNVFAKVDEYLAAGTRVVVVLDPGAGEASVHRAGAEQQLLAADAELTLPDVLPGFAVPLAKLFE